MKRGRWIFICLGILAVGIGVMAIFTHGEKSILGGELWENYTAKEKKGDFWEYTCPTPNIQEGKNDVKAIVLHHTATADTKSSLQILTQRRERGNVSCHVLIAPDGTRYVLAPPESITWHAGRSRLNGRNNCNNFTIGIEFQGNTIEKPLTEAQIKSAIDYCLPIMKKYKIPMSGIVSHQQIRTEYLKAYPKSGVASKVDITPGELNRFKKALHEVRRANGK
ncbi:MAG: N-acetylmuramoyl-L-alanine amidase [Muribaculaceae bacterium]|nr:N-acetylmuramoyl-L-alanine amidase [Muribaculaceae bacterium]